MEKQQKLDKTFINIAKEIGSLSHCTRSKVGAVLVKDGNVISFGYNGTPAGMDNCCENKLYVKNNIAAAFQPLERIEADYPLVDENDNFRDRYKLVTKDEVIHAEMNAILKAAKSGNAVDGSTLYLSLSPCQNCCKLIIQSGISRVVYLEDYRDISPVIFLSKFIQVDKHVI